MSVGWGATKRNIVSPHVLTKLLTEKGFYIVWTILNCPFTVHLPEKGKIMWLYLNGLLTHSSEILPKRTYVLRRKISNSFQWKKKSIFRASNFVISNSIKLIFLRVRLKPYFHKRNQNLRAEYESKNWSLFRIERSTFLYRNSRKMREDILILSVIFAWTLSNYVSCFFCFLVNNDVHLGQIEINNFPVS